MSTPTDRVAIMNALLDVAEVYEPTGFTPAMEQAYTRLHEVGAVLVQVDDESGDVDIDVSRLLDGYGAVADLLLGVLVQLTGADRDDVIARLRADLAE